MPLDSARLGRSVNNDSELVRVKLPFDENAKLVGDVSRRDVGRDEVG